MLGTRHVSMGCHVSEIIIAPVGFCVQAMGAATAIRGIAHLHALTFLVHRPVPA